MLVGGPDAQVTEDWGVVTVALPPGATATVRSSSTLDERGLALLGMWDWIADTVPADRRPDVLAGGHQMVTPGEQLELVHATQRPLERPRLADRLRAHREYGDTHTRFRGTLRSQSATTSRIDVEAQWSEWFDDPAFGQPPRLVGGHTGHAFDLPVADDTITLTGAPGGRGSADPRHELHDTLHRHVSYVATATTRFREYLPPPLAGDPTELAVTGAATTIHVPCSARPAPPAVHSVMPTFRWSDLPADPFAPDVRARRRPGDCVSGCTAPGTSPVTARCSASSSPALTASSGHQTCGGSTHRSGERTPSGSPASSPRRSRALGTSVMTVSSCVIGSPSPNSAGRRRTVTRV